MVFEEYLKSVEPVIYLISKKYNIPGMDSNDIQQEIRIKIWVNFNKYNSQLERSKYNWIKSVAINTVHDLYRKQNRHKRMALNNYKQLSEINF